MSDRLIIDTAGFYRDVVGADGIDRSELDKVSKDLKNAHQVLVRRSAGGLQAEYACLNLHDHLQTSLSDIEAAAVLLRQFKDIAVVGIGGSSLGAKAVYQSLVIPDPSQKMPRLHFLENVDPRNLTAFIQNRSAKDCGVICISKSGGTIETAGQYLILREWLAQQLGQQKALQHQWIVTDPESGWLRHLAIREGIPTLPVPSRVGGRYSVLTAVGLLPLAVVGINIRALLEGSATNASRCTADSLKENPALEMAALFYLLDTLRHKSLSIMMPYADALQLFGDWYRQLWAESLGKRRDDRPDDPPVGTLPVTALGTVDQHSQLQMYLESRRDKMFTFLSIERWPTNPSIPLPAEDREAFRFFEGKTMQDVLEAEFQATRQVITEYGHPNMSLRLPVLNEQILGQLIDLYQRVTVYTGLLYGINPLDQPAVEKGKKLAIQMLRDSH